MFNKVLVTNRGEISVRVVRALRDRGIRSAVAFAAADRHGLAVRLADEAWEVPALGPREAYLNVAALVSLAGRIGADAIHPGYGFLSEQAEFAESCAEHGITFIGPRPQNIRDLGDKNSARRLMQQAGVPLVPGTEALSDVSQAREEAARIGYPVLLKAAHGGGGRGIRRVARPEDLADAFRSAQSEAAAAFGRGDVYLEKHIVGPRHIEIQVAADEHGGVVAFPERECSIQRRFQKMIEESPSPHLTPEVRAAMREAASRGAASVGYRNVGTFEFLVDEARQFYFLEVNTRLQVEHPVTEAICGVDLVSWQLDLAAGRPLPTQDIAWQGWAFEARITCEDAFARFVPGPGRITDLELPHGPGVRVDAGIYRGYEVPPHYDSLLAKLIVHGADRDEARRRTLRALDEFHLSGIPTTLPFHRWLFSHPRFAAGDFTTHFLTEHEAEFAPSPTPSNIIDAAALIAALHDIEEHRPLPASTTPATEWSRTARRELQR